MPAVVRRGALPTAMVPALLLALAATSVPARAQTGYIAYGDSITKGVGDTVQDGTAGYPARLQKLLDQAGLPAEVKNYGVGGQSTAEGLTLIDGVLDQNQTADVLLLMEGTNDLHDGIGPETTVFNLNQMAFKAEARSMSVVHATCIPRKPDATYDPDNVVNLRLAEGIRDLAGRRKRDLVDPFEVFSELPDLFSKYYAVFPPSEPDPVGHPNPAGYDVLAQAFFDVLRDVDHVPPVPGLTTPINGEEAAPAQGPISVDVWDFGTGIDLANTTLLVNGTATGVVPTGDAQHAQLTYTPATPLHAIVTVTLRTRDLASPPNSFERPVTTFVVAGTVFLAGDLDRDGRVDGKDLVLLARAFGARTNDARFLAAADIDGNGIVDGVDLARLAANFGKQSF